MRRNDREITDKEAIAAFLSGEQILRVAFYDDGDIYIVPVNYGYCEENDCICFYFHGAKAGRKYTLAQNNPRVGFEIDGHYALVSAETGCGHSANYQSVIGTGTLHLVSDPAEQRRGLNCIMQQATGKAYWEYNSAVLERTAVFRLDAETLTCKARCGETPRASV